MSLSPPGSPDCSALAGCRLLTWAIAPAVMLPRQDLLGAQKWVRQRNQPRCVAIACGGLGLSIGPLAPPVFHPACLERRCAAPGGSGGWRGT